MTLNHTIETSPDVRYRQEVSALNPHELSMLRALEQDVELARSKSKPATGLRIFKKVHHTFFVLPNQTSALDKLLKQARVQRSCLVLDESCGMTLDLLSKLVGIVRLKGHRINDLNCHPAQLGREINCEYFEFRVDLEGS